MAKPELYFVTDIETDGPCPGKHSMLSLASVVVNDQAQTVATFSVNLTTLAGATQDRNTMKFWKTEPEAWDATREGTIDAKEGMSQFVKWVRDVCKGQHHAVFVGFPSTFDFTFVYWYLHHFELDNPFTWSALDMKTMAMTLTGLNFKKTIKPNFPKEWIPLDFAHTHVALDDAKEQAEIFKAMLMHWKSNFPIGTTIAELDLI